MLVANSYGRAYEATFVIWGWARKEWGRPGASAFPAMAARQAKRWSPEARGASAAAYSADAVTASNTAAAPRAS